MQRHYAKLLRATLTASSMLVAIAGAAVAGPFEDAGAAYQRGDYATALRLLQPLATQGDVNAQNNLGLLYQNGQGVPQDHNEAMRLFRLAVAQGYARAQNNLGLMYLNGLGVPQD